DFDRQHIRGEEFRSHEFLPRPPDARNPDRRQVLWSPRATAREGAFRVHYEFFCDMECRRPTSPMSRLSQSLYAPPQPAQYLKSEYRIECDNPDVAALARQLTDGLTEPGDQLEALFHFVDGEIGREPAVGGPGVSALGCLQNRVGDSGAKSRLLVALCR